MPAAMLAARIHSSMALKKVNIPKENTKYASLVRDYHLSEVTKNNELSVVEFTFYEHAIILCSCTAYLLY